MEKNQDTLILDIFYQDTIKREEIDVKHCPTEQMIAVFFTKPLQDSLFLTMRDIVMGLSSYPTKERVEK